MSTVTRSISTRESVFQERILHMSVTEKLLNIVQIVIPLSKEDSPTTRKYEETRKLSVTSPLPRNMFNNLR